MKDIAILMPCWKSPELLKVSIPSLVKSSTLDTEIVVILNEADNESIAYLNLIGIKHIDLEVNLGPSAVDIAIPYIQERFQYVANVNSDMAFSYGWDESLINLMKMNGRSTTSACLVEPVANQHSVHLFLGEFTKAGLHEEFNQLVTAGKTKTNQSISYNHPIVTTMSDFIKVGGYSDNIDPAWVVLGGRGLDDYFAWRLWSAYGGNYKFLKSDNSFVYHGVSLNSKKLMVRESGRNTFHAKTGISIDEFRERIGYPH